MPPSVRQAFGRSLGGEAAMNGSTAEATEALLATLVSDSNDRASVLGQRFRKLKGQRFFEVVSSWGYYDFPLRRPKLSDKFFAAGDQVFDFPEFPRTDPPIGVRDLIPSIEEPHHAAEAP
jgi:hypothetical protein